MLDLAMVPFLTFSVLTVTRDGSFRCLSYTCRKETEDLLDTYLILDVCKGAKGDKCVSSCWKEEQPPQLKAPLLIKNNLGYTFRSYNLFILLLKIPMFTFILNQ